MTETSTVLSLALQLPHAERADVAYELLLSLEDAAFDTNVDAAWRAEIERRL